MSYFQASMTEEDNNSTGAEAQHFELAPVWDDSNMNCSTGRLCPAIELRQEKTDETKESASNMNDSTTSISVRDLRMSDSGSPAEEKEKKKDPLEDFFLMLIIVNSIMIGISTFDFVTEHERASEVFYYFDLVFLVIFTIELFITFFRKKWDAFKNSWVVFDFTVIVLTWSLSAIGKFDPSHEGSNGVQVLRSLRIMRLLPRIKSFKEIMDAIARSFGKLGFLLLFLGIIMFIFAIFFTEQYKHMYRDGQTEFDYFSRLDHTLLTLLQLMTFDNWNIVLREVMDTYPAFWIPCLVYVIITGFVIINLAIAVICEPIFDLKTGGETKITKMEKEIRQLENMMQTMCCEIYEELDLTKPLSATHPQYSSFYGLSVRSPTQEKKDISAAKICATVYNSDTLSWKTFRQLCGIIEDPYLKWFLILAVIINSILIAVATFDFVDENDSISSVFETVDTIFLCIYSLEAIMILIHYGPKMFKDSWLAFDFILVVVCWATRLSPAFRIFRVIRVVRVFPKFDGMRVITETLYTSVPKIATITGILLAWFFIFAVMYTALFKDIPVGGENGLGADYFSRLDKSLLTLFQFMTYSDWAEISRELSMHFSWAPIPSSIFILISELLFVNAIIALICQSHEDVKNKQREERVRIRSIEKTPEERWEDIKTMKSDLLDKMKTSRTSEFKQGKSFIPLRRSSSMEF